MTVFLVMMAIGLVIGGSLGVVISKRRPHAAADASASASAAPASTVQPEVAKAYAEGLEAQRAADPSGMNAALQRTVGLDPTFAPAHLQLGLSRLTQSAAAARPHLEAAERHAARLDDRERAILRALEPCTRSSSPDVGPCVGPLRAVLSGAAAADPMLHALVGWLLLRIGEPGEGLAVTSRGLALDPRFAFGWFTRGTLEAFLGRFDDALASFEACTKHSPGAIACLRSKALLHSHLGEPGACERTARAITERSPSDPLGTMILADALAANGKPEQEVRAAIARAVAAAPEARRAGLAERLEGALAIRQGDLKRAVLQYQLALEKSEGDADPSRYRVLVWPLLELLVEIGEEKRAGEIATEMARQVARKGWTESDEPHAPLLHPGPVLTVARRRGKATDAAGKTRDLEALFAAYEQKQPRAILPSAWLAIFGATADSQAEAEDAYRRLKAGYLRSDVYVPGLPRLVGKAARLAGRTEEALGDLDPASRSCLALTAPLADLQATYELGLAREARKDKPAACAAFASVLERWGSARPVPATARRAKKRRLALRCD